ncbi:acetylcholine receptor subunit alpha-type acr-16-like [Panulirus ornatus]|uniref:acetylcholine receptor subunit alpha-type acr-16-like n=1 Tax=Panulirus ornatus TaxID=150431 RepID=UPI003A8ACC81
MGNETSSLQGLTQPPDGKAGGAVPPLSPPPAGAPPRLLRETMGPPDGPDLLTATSSSEAPSAATTGVLVSQDSPRAFDAALYEPRLNTFRQLPDHTGPRDLVPPTTDKRDLESPAKTTSTMDLQLASPQRAARPPDDDDLPLAAAGDPSGASHQAGPGAGSGRVRRGSPALTPPLIEPDTGYSSVLDTLSPQGDESLTPAAPARDNRPASPAESGDDGGGGAAPAPAPPGGQVSAAGGHDPSSKGGGDTGARRKVGHKKSDQHILYNDIFKHYNKKIRPIISHDDVITVHFQIALFNVLSLDSKKGVMVTNTEMVMTWVDPYLTWRPEDYNHTTVMRVLYSDVWHPDVILYNTADTSYESSMIHTNIIVSHDGTCKLMVHAVLTSVCDIDIQWFPFDQQTCKMNFASWTSDISQMRLQVGPSDISRFHPNHEFFLENFYSETKNEYNPCCAEPFSMIVYHIQLQRRVKFALFFFIVPGILINICALLVFSLPSETGEKVGLGINSMLAMMVFLMAMTENLPPTETLPLAGVYYGVCLIVLTFNIVLSVYVLNLSYTGDRGHQVPLWVRWVAVVSARLVQMKIPELIRQAWELDLEQVVKNDRVRPFADEDDDPVATDLHFRVVKVEATAAVEGTAMFKDAYQRRSLEALEGIHRLLSERNSEDKANSKRSRLVEEWKFLSRVLDRSLFIIFGIITLLFNAIILSQSPYSEQFEYCEQGAGLCDNDYSEDYSFPSPVGGMH